MVDTALGNWNGVDDRNLELQPTRHYWQNHASTSWMMMESLNQSESRSGVIQVELWSFATEINSNIFIGPGV